MYRELFRMPGVDVTVKNLNEAFEKVFGFQYFNDFDYQIFDIKDSDLAITHGHGFIAEVDEETVIYIEEF